MIQFGQAKSLSPVRRDVGPGLDALRRDIEGAYLGAGETLIEMEGRIGELREPLDDLVEHAPTVLRAVGEHAGRLCLSAERLEADLLDRGHGVAELRHTIETLNANVTGIAHMLRTMKFVAMNARIHVFSLSVRNPRLEAFTVNVSDLVAGSDAILSRVDVITTEISGCLAELAKTWIPLVREDIAALRPEFEALGRGVAEFAGDRRNESSFGKPLAIHLEHLKEDFDRIIVSLQAGDRASQRIDHGACILGWADQGVGDWALFGLGRDQLAAAHADLRDQTARIVEIQRAAVERLELMAGLAGTDNARERVHLFAALHERVLRAQGSVARIADRRTHMLGAAETAVDRMADLRGVLCDVSSLAEDLRLVGTNAVLACLDLGDEGDALKEIAIQLRLLAAGAAARFKDVWEALGATDTRLSELVDGIRDRPARAIAEIEQSGAEMATGIDRVFLSAQAVCERTGDLLSSLRGSLPRTCESMQRQVDRLGALVRDLPADGPAPVRGGADQGRFDAAWSLYSMDDERTIHRDYARRIGLAPGPEKSEVATAPDIDIFF